jgi:hypothetical protein
MLDLMYNIKFIGIYWFLFYEIVDTDKIICLILDKLIFLIWKIIEFYHCLKNC